MFTRHVLTNFRHDFSYIQDDTMKDIVHRLRYHQSPFELREKWAYNNEAYTLLNAVICFL